MTAIPKKLRVPDLAQMKKRGERIVMLTAYDATMARLFDRAGVDVLLVGDSLGHVILGLDTTIPVTLEAIIHHTFGVTRGARRALVVADTDADNLRRLRCAYRLLLLGKSTPNCQYCELQMKEFFAGEEANLADVFPPRGWFNVGTKHQIDAKACYVGRHGDTCVWVTSEGMNGLAVFTMGALDLATGKLHSPQQTVIWSRLKSLRPRTIRTP
jgi:Ketopantoate hydroxymethyltransferase